MMYGDGNPPARRLSQKRRIKDKWTNENKDVIE